ncbi:MAG: HAMP domain-containing sensor histidine kinase [Reyranella sp.]|uniref:sensor histidine kinase n=1 Tax=Reyranella sp. TaxID=1929291 RepID=UPI00272FC29D|nr:HAMP domain-containing sensor histidine kinase [Reyranella sp.]MDP1962800.1 HAMP domain-containing sensor histidine kinase [Reyranella sp.]MDP2375791.1 HAMP domain-containing sensor histidine kinase [Reyranella sp.]
MIRFRSIASRVVALQVLAIGATAILLPLALYWLLTQAANNLHRDALRSQAVTIGSFLRLQPDGTVALEIPDDVRPLYSDGYGLYAYAVLDAAGRVLFSSRADGAALFPSSDVAPSDEIRGDEIRRPRRTGAVLFGVTVARVLGERIFWVQVGQDLSHRDVIIDDIVATFFVRVAWIIFPILLVLLLIDVLIFRRALAPVREASTTAAAIGPSRTDVRLPEQSMPAEIVPLVRAVNQALERLEAGYLAQREFTADVAHELRTPLAIMRARVDALDPGPARDALRADIVGMARTVGQVLDIAELESFVVGPDATADLHAVCSDAVAYMAPLAVGQSKTIALSGAEGPVRVRGHADALFRAVRNLIENAIRHTPLGGSIEVEVSADGSVRVVDDGPGVLEADRRSIFTRFWRRDRAHADSRGLGLAIVARVAEAHGGSIAVENRPEGGAVFTLRLQVP